MSTARFSFAQIPGEIAHLSPEDTHYIRDVLRLRVGDPLEVGNSDTGVIALTTITATEPVVSVSLRSIVSGDTSPIGPTLLCALLKGQKNDLICDWATELGCSRLIFWQSSRSIVRIDNEKDRLHKEARLTKIAVAASQQSKQSKPPEVRITQSLADALMMLLTQPSCNELRLICSLGSGAQPIQTAIASSEKAAPCVVAIGPEGDFTREEEQILASHGFVPVSLGDRTLRSELAVVTVLSYLGIRPAVA